MPKKVTTTVMTVAALFTIGMGEAMASTSKLKAGGCVALGVICFFAFILGVVMVIKGFMEVNAGHTENAKLKIIAGFGIAGACGIMTIAFTAMGLEMSGVEPDFDW